MKMVIDMKDYERKAFYHETDQMGIIHHSNYLKWLEEARVDLFDQMGLSYKRMEELGVISPVLAIQVEYKNAVMFDEVVRIQTHIKEYNGIRLELSYEIISESRNILCTTASSKHCFLKNGKVISLKKELPQYHELFMKLKEEV